MLKNFVNEQLMINRFNDCTLLLTDTVLDSLTLAVQAHD